MPQTFDEFFRDNYDDVVHNLSRAGCADHVAGDCSQEAFIRAYARWWRVGRMENPAAWVQRVANNIRIDMQRGRVRHQKALSSTAVDWVNEEPMPPGPDPVVEHAVAALPGQQREAVDIYYGHGYSTDEGAAAMGISPGAFRYHLHRARRSLRSALGGRSSASALNSEA